MRFFALFVIAAVSQLVAAEILWDTCEGEADFPDIKEGNFYNLCIRDHEFVDKKWAWTLTKSTISNTVFDGCLFENTREKTSNFTEASWNSVVFKNCDFSSNTDNAMIFDETVLNDVEFIGCTFHRRAPIHFTKFLFNNVSFVDCDFQSDTNFTLGQINGMVVRDSRIKRNADAVTPSGNDAFRMRQLTVRDLLIKDSQFINPIRFEGVAGADFAINDTTFNKLFCHSLEETGPFQSDPEIRYFSGFNDSVLAGVEFFDKVLCDQTSWHGMHFENVTFWNDATFANSDILDLYWNNVNMSTQDGSQSELDFSNSYIKRRVLANTSVDVGNFKGTIFETVLVDSFVATTPRFEEAEFRQEYIDGTCCTVSCKSLKCVCNVTEPSGACPEGDSSVNVHIIPTCFPESASLRRYDGSSIDMKDVAVAEKIAIGGGEHSDIYFFGHRSPEATAEFISIEHDASQKPLRISPDHYLYVNGKLSTARMVKVGDMLRDAHGKDTVTVLATNRELHRGLFAPTSLHGDLLVDDIVVSSYTKALHPDLAHKMLYPLRLLYRYAPASMLSRFTMFHERSWAGVARMLRLPEGMDIIDL